MEFLSTHKPRSYSSRSLDLAAAREAGLGLALTFNDNPLEAEPRIVFNTPSNLTKTLIETNALSAPSPSEAQDISPPNENPQIMNCIFFSRYMPKIFAPGSSHYSPIVIPHLFDTAILKQLPMTKCKKHGTSGFLPYDYVKRLPEYTCFIYRQPVFKVVHSFEECILKFPPAAHPIGSSSQHLHEQYLMKKYCYHCFQRFSRQSDLYMFSTGCRSEASVTRFWYKKMMKALEKYLSSTGELAEGDSIFTIEP